MGPQLLYAVVLAIFLVIVVALFARALGRILQALRGQRTAGMDTLDDDLAVGCPFCGFDLRGGHVVCPECGQRVFAEDGVARAAAAFDLGRLTTEWPPTRIEPVAPASGERQIALYATPDILLAEAIARQLNARGVWTRVHSGTASETVGAKEFSYTVYRVMVSDDDLDAGKAILDRFRPVRRQRG